MTIAVPARWRAVPLAAAVLLLGQYGVWTAGTQAVRGPRWVVAVAVGIAALGLVLRIRRPPASVALACIASLAPALAWGTSELLGFVAAGAVALFACGRHAPRAHALAAAAVGFGTALALDALAPQERLASSWSFALWMPALVAAGMWVRQQAELGLRRTELAAEHERLVAAEHRLALARDLHDSLSNSLAIMVLHAEAAELILHRDPAGATGALGEVTTAGRRALGQIRSFVAALRTPGSAPAAVELGRVLDEMGGAGLAITTTGLEELATLPEAARRELVRVVQEALTNALRHAGPVAVRVGASRDGDAVSLRVDNDAATVPWPPQHGHGLRGMRERVAALGGTITTAPRPGGFVVDVRLPSVAAAAPSPVAGAGSLR